MPAHRTRTRAAFSDVSSKEEKIHYLLNRRDRVLVLGKAHRPATNDPLRAHRDFRGSANLIARQSAALNDLFPRSRTHLSRELLEADRVLLNEWSIQHRAGTTLFFLEHLLRDPAHRGHVAVD